METTDGALPTPFLHFYCAIWRDTDINLRKLVNAPQTTLESPHDGALLRDYVAHGSQTAFETLVQRRIGMVLAAALRQCGGNRASAEDVTQQTFIELGKQAAQLQKHPSLTGWLYTTTHHIARASDRADRRRREREQTVETMTDAMPASPPPLDSVALNTALDDVMHELNEQERTPLLLRFFDNRSHKEIGTVLGLSENAARMRVERALEKLRLRLARRGIQSTDAALAAWLVANAILIPPSAFAQACATAAVTAATALTPTPSTLSSLMIPSKTIAIVASAATAVLTVTSFSLWKENSSLRGSTGTPNASATAADTAPTAPSNALTLSAELEALRREHAELIKLRGEVTQLRERLRSEAAPRTPPAPTPIVPQVSQEAIDQERDRGILQMNVAKNWVLLFHRYAEAHGDRFPDDFDKTLAHLKEADPGENTPFSKDQIEITWSGSIKDLTEPQKTIVLRERQPRPAVRGNGFTRTYGFADGHSEIHREDTLDFQAWEAERSGPAARTQ